MRWAVLAALVGCGSEGVPSLEVRGLDKLEQWRLVDAVIGFETSLARRTLAELDASYAPGGCPIKTVDGDVVTYRGPCTVALSYGNVYVIDGVARVERGEGHRFDGFVVSGTASEPRIHTGVFDGSFPPAGRAISHVDFTMDRDGHALHTDLVTTCEGSSVRCTVRGYVVLDGEGALVWGSLVWHEDTEHRILQPGSAWRVIGHDAAIAAEITTNALNTGICFLWRVGDGPDQGFCER